MAGGILVQQSNAGLTKGAAFGHWRQVYDLELLGPSAKTGLLHAFYDVPNRHWLARRDLIAIEAEGDPASIHFTSYLFPPVVVDL